MLQNSVATQLKRGGIFNNHVIAHCQQNVPIKNLENRLIFDKVMHNDQVECF